jgi:quercetin dioxygenase-like cupin family protein
MAPTWMRHCAVERGESGLSVQVFNRIADALDIPASDLASVTPGVRAVMRTPERPRTVLAAGVTWEELVSSRHSMAPALLLAEPGGSSGGTVNSSRENFVTVLAGELTVDVAPPTERHVLGTGDSLMIMPGQTHSWINSGESDVRAIWVEQLKG